MTEPGPRELRRLAALEERLEKTRGERAQLASERTELRRAVAAAERAARTAEQQVSALVEENRRLAEELEGSRAEAEQLRRAAQEGKDAVTDLRRRVRQAESAAARVEKRVASVERERDRALDRLKAAEAQVKGKPAPLVPAREAASLVGELIENLEGGLGGAAVREGELRLKVGFGRIGRTTGLVLPTPETADELRGALHDVSIRFDRSPPESPEPTS